jgi:hypothetical protein
MANKVSVGMSLLNDETLKRSLERLAENVRNKIAMEAVENAISIVESVVRANTPVSTGSRRKQSASTKANWSGSRPLKTTIRSVVRTRTRAGINAGATGYAGPAYSEGGGHGNLFSKDHKRKVTWGHDSGTIRTVNQFIKKSADMSADLAEQEIVDTVRTRINAFAKSLPNG